MMFELKGAIYGPNPIIPWGGKLKGVVRVGPDILRGSGRLFKPIYCWGKEKGVALKGSKNSLEFWCGY
jgi:hypothetical protein